MFELTKEENDVLRSRFVTLRHGRHSKYLPFAFSEHGILKVDNQDKNIEVIFRYFDELLEQKAQPRKEIGYKISKEK